MDRTSPSYRADIDGLRGIAVLAVVLYHAFPSLVPGGYVGVDVFFVISGYLITRILLGALHERRFSLWDFYANRIRRIFPALVVVLVVTVVLGMGLLLPEEFRHLSRHVAGAAIFISNFLLWQESGYFDAEVETKPLLHLWSLGIEEQFYLAWPLLLWITWRKRPLFAGILFVAFACSLVLNVVLVTRDAAAAFYSPLTRCWELILGASIAAGLDWHAAPSRPARIAAGVAALAAIATMAFAAFGIPRGSPYPGWWALAPTLATFALIAMPQTWLHRNVLASRPLVGIGLVSYPLYLWHWPLISFAHISGRSDAKTLAILVGASLVLAALTYFLVERPIRFGRAFAQRKAQALVAAMAIVAVAGLAGMQASLRPLLGDDKLADFEREVKWTYIDAPDFKPVTFGTGDFPGAAKLHADLAATAGTGHLLFREIPSKQRTKALYIGDSQVEQFWPRVGERIRQAPEQARTAVFLTASAFLPIPDTHYNPSTAFPHFEGLATTMMEYALSDPAIDTVVISAMWRIYLRDGDVRGRKRKDSPFYALVDGKPEQLMAGRRANEVALGNLEKMVRRLRDAGKRVFLMQEIPAQGVLRIRRTWGAYEHAPSTEPREEWLRRNAHLRGELARIAAATGAEVIDPYPFLCREAACDTRYEGHHPVYRDASHLTDRYVRNYATFMDRTIDLGR